MVEPDPMIALFGVYLFVLKHRVSAQSTIVWNGHCKENDFKRLWKSDAVAQFNIWIGDLIGILHMFQNSLMYNLNTFSDICQPFLAQPDKCVYAVLFAESPSFFCACFL